MSNIIPITLDNIIFSLQKSGGISVVWQKNLEKIIEDEDFLSRFIEYDNAKLNFFRQQFLINSISLDVKNSRYLFLQRYLNLNLKMKEKYLFHSSYYRIANDKNAINLTTVHDFTYEYFMNGYAQKIHSWQKKKSINNSDGIICVSESTKRDLLRFFPYIKENKIRVVYNGVDEAFRCLSKGLILKELPFDSNSYVIFVGARQSLYKNFKSAVLASSIAKKKLLLIGGGALSTQEQIYLGKVIGDKNYKCLLNVDVDDLNYYYNHAICLLYPSLYEGFGIPIVEAQKAGCPVIATNCSSIPEIIANSSLALDVPNERKIAKLICELSNDVHLRNETIEMGFEKSKKFSWQNTYIQTKEFYKELFCNK